MDWPVRSPTVIGTEITPGVPLTVGRETALSSGAEVSLTTGALRRKKSDGDPKTPNTPATVSNTPAIRAKAETFTPQKRDGIWLFDMKTSLRLPYRCRRFKSELLENNAPDTSNAPLHIKG